jgi:hypothetical protein
MAPTSCGGAVEDEDEEFEREKQEWFNQQMRQ